MTLSTRLSAALVALAAVATIALPACNGDTTQVATNGIPPTKKAKASSTAIRLSLFSRITRITDSQVDRKLPSMPLTP